MAKIEAGDVVSHEDDFSRIVLFGRVYLVLGTQALVRFSDVLERWIPTCLLTVEQKAEAA